MMEKNKKLFLIPIFIVLLSFFAYGSIGDIPTSIYIGSGLSSANQITLSSYTSEVPNFITIVNPINNYTTRINVTNGIEYNNLINGVYYSFVNDGFDVFIWIELGASVQSHNTDIYIHFDNQIYKVVMRYSTIIPVKYWDVASTTLNYNTEKSFDMSNYFLKSLILPNGYINLGASVVYMDENKNYLGAVALTNGYGYKETSNFIIEVNGDIIKVISKNNDYRFYVRMRVYNRYGNYAYSDAYFNIVGSVNPISSINVNTLSATNVYSNSANIRGEITNINSFPVNLYFDYKPYYSTNWASVNLGSKSNKGVYNYVLNSLQSDFQYDYRIRVTQGINEYVGNTKSFTTQGMSNIDDYYPYSLNLLLNGYTISNGSSVTIPLGSNFVNYDYISIFLPRIENNVVTGIYNVRKGQSGNMGDYNYTFSVFDTLTIYNIDCDRNATIEIGVTNTYGSITKMIGLYFVLNDYAINESGLPIDNDGGDVDDYEIGYYESHYYNVSEYFSNYDFFNFYYSIDGSDFIELQYNDDVEFSFGSIKTNDYGLLNFTSTNENIPTDYFRYYAVAYNINGQTTGRTKSVRINDTLGDLLPVISTINDIYLSNRSDGTEYYFVPIDLYLDNYEYINVYTKLSNETEYVNVNDGFDYNGFVFNYYYTIGSNNDYDNSFTFTNTDDSVLIYNFKVDVFNDNGNETLFFDVYLNTIGYGYTPNIIWDIPDYQMNYYDTITDNYYPFDRANNITFIYPDGHGNLLIAPFDEIVSTDYFDLYLDSYETNFTITSKNESFDDVFYIIGCLDGCNSTSFNVNIFNSSLGFLQGVPDIFMKYNTTKNIYMYDYVNSFNTYYAYFPSLNLEYESDAYGNPVYAENEYFRILLWNDVLSFESKNNDFNDDNLTIGVRDDSGDLADVLKFYIGDNIPIKLKGLPDIILDYNEEFTIDLNTYFDNYNMVYLEFYEIDTNTGLFLTNNVVYDYSYANMSMNSDIITIRSKEKPRNSYELVTFGACNENGCVTQQVRFVITSGKVYDETFNKIFPNSEEISQRGMFGRIFALLLITLILGVILSLNSGYAKLITSIVVALIVLELVFLAYIGYIPVWIIILMALISIIAVATFINKIGSGSGA